MTNGRVHLIDEVRGFAIICMVVYHTFYDLVVIFGVNIPIFYTDFIEVLVYIFVGLFVFISGTASEFSKSNLLRGFKCLGFGLLMTAFTFFFMRDQLIVFGILHMLGCSMIIYGLLSKWIRKIPPLMLIIIVTLLFILTYGVSDGSIGIGGVFSIKLPRVLYDVKFLFPLGFVSSTFYSADYFGLLPWFFCFLAGSGFGRLIRQRRLPQFVYDSHIKPLSFVGRNTLVIYVVHQPVVYGILYLIFKII